MDPPRYPTGPFVAEPAIDAHRRQELIAVIEGAPKLLRAQVDGFSERQLDTRYKNWTIRQIVHHLADSHVNSYIRFKWALTEVLPMIKAYDEERWSALPDARTGEIRAALALMEGLHARWLQLLRSMAVEDFDRAFIHPALSDLT